MLEMKLTHLPSGEKRGAAALPTRAMRATAAATSSFALACGCAGTISAVLIKPASTMHENFRFSMLPLHALISINKFTTHFPAALYNSPPAHQCGYQCGPSAAPEILET